MIVSGCAQFDRANGAAGPILRHPRGATDGVGYVECGSSRYGPRVRHQQCGEPDCTACRRSPGRRRRILLEWLRSWPSNSSDPFDWRSLYGRGDNAADRGEIGWLATSPLSTLSIVEND